MSILNRNNPIGFFDSGVGGLTVLKEFKKLLPNESIIFYGDTLHVPYGDKTKEQLLEFSEPILKFFEQQNCKAVVMACNTTSAVIYDTIKDKYHFKLYPVVQSVSKVLAEMNFKRLGVFATSATIKSSAYQNEIHKYNSNVCVFGQECHDWVRIVEQNLINDDKSIKTVKNDLDKMLSNNPQKIVLGCTHYPYLLPILEKFVPKDMFIDPAKFLSEYIAKDLGKNNLLTDTCDFEESFYCSNNPQQFLQASKMFYSLPSEPQLKIFNSYVA